MLVVEFKSDQFSTNESSGFAELAVTISGGSSTTPISVMVTTSERSATGKGNRTMQNFVGRKFWQIWQFARDSPNFLVQIFPS